MRKFQVGPMPAPIDPALAARFARLEVALIGHFRFRGFVHHAIRPVHPISGCIVGTAVTVAAPGPDGTAVHHALSLARPGDFLVIDRLGDDRYACIGGGTGLAAQTAGAAGIVLDGPVTDPDEIRDLGLPVWARGVSGITTRILNLGGAVNVPVAVGNVPVLPGDYVVADPVGIVIIPAAEAEDTLREAEARAPHSPATQARVRAGEKLGDISGASKHVADDQK
jgi:4-hydroxy-4-methyl-2-oxoglutarate aldolase